MGSCESCNLPGFFLLDGKQDMIETKICEENALKVKCV